MFDHVGVEVSDLKRSSAFYDAVFFALGVRRLHETERAVAYGVNEARFWIVMRDRPPAPGFGHLAFAASGKAAVDGAFAAGLAHGGRSDGEPGPRPQYGPRYYAGYLIDPDSLRIEIAAAGR